MKLRSIYLVLLVPLLIGIVITAVLRYSLFPFTHAASISRQVPLPSNTNIFTHNSQLVAKMDPSQPITLAVGLSLRNSVGLAAYLQQITLPDSSLYHHYLSPATFNALYAPSPVSETAVSNFLQSQGFKITTTYPNQIATAYNFTQLYNAGMLGEGQTVGLLELDGFFRSDDPRQKMRIVASEEILLYLPFISANITSCRKRPIR